MQGQNGRPGLSVKVLDLRDHLFYGLGQSLLLLLVEGRDIRVVVGGHGVDVGFDAAEAEHRRAVVGRAVEYDIHHPAGLLVAGILRFQRNVVVGGQNGIGGRGLEGLENDGRTVLIGDGNGYGHAEEVPVVAGIILGLGLVVLGSGKDPEVRLHFAQRLRPADALGPEQDLICREHDLLHAVVVGVLFRVEVDLFLAVDDAQDLLVRIDEGFAVEGVDRNVFLVLFNQRIAAAVQEEHIEDAAPGHHAVAVFGVVDPVAVRIVPADGRHLGQLVEGPLAAVDQLVGIFQIVIVEDALVEEHADRFVDLGRQKVADADEQFVADGKLFIGVVIPVGLFEILMGKRFQIDQIARLGLRENVCALHEGQIEGTVAGHDRILDLIRRLLDFGDPDVHTLFHGEVALEDRRGNRLRRVLVRGDVDRDEPGVGLRVGIVDHIFVPFEIRFGKVVGYDGFRFGLLDDLRGKLRFRRAWGVRVFNAFAAGGQEQKQRKNDGSNSFVHFDFLSLKK